MNRNVVCDYCGKMLLIDKTVTISTADGDMIACARCERRVNNAVIKRGHYMQFDSREDSY